jgi:hypothetical protein
MGKSWWLLVLCAACANNVPQDRSTGPDGKLAGAKEVTLEEGIADDRGIVTYPGGDRIDWKKITLPEKARGKLDLQMTYTTPRPDLKLSFDVFDQWHVPVKQAVSGRGRNKSMTIDNAKGTYFIRVYAPRRGDAGNYRLTASFVPLESGVPAASIEVADPPRLPAVPDPAPTSCPTYDPSNPICKNECAPGSPPNHKPCLSSAPTPTPPPTPPIVVEKPVVLKPVIARIMKSEVAPDGSIQIIIGAGSETGVGKDWKTGSLLRGETQAKLPGANLTIIRVDKRTTSAKLRLGITSDVINANSNVILEP